MDPRGRSVLDANIWTCPALARRFANFCRCTNSPLSTLMMPQPRSLGGVRMVLSSSAAGAQLNLRDSAAP